MISWKNLVQRHLRTALSEETNTPETAINNRTLLEATGLTLAGRQRVHEATGIAMFAGHGQDILDLEMPIDVEVANDFETLVDSSAYAFEEALDEAMVHIALDANEPNIDPDRDDDLPFPTDSRKRTYVAKVEQLYRARLNAEALPIATLTALLTAKTYGNVIDALFKLETKRIRTRGTQP